MEKKPPPSITMRQTTVAGVDFQSSRLRSACSVPSEKTHGLNLLAHEHGEDEVGKEEAEITTPLATATLRVNPSTSPNPCSPPLHAAPDKSFAGSGDLDPLPASGSSSPVSSPASASAPTNTAATATAAAAAVYPPHSLSSSPGAPLPTSEKTPTVAASSPLIQSSVATQTVASVVESSPTATMLRSPSLAAVVDTKTHKTPAVLSPTIDSGQATVTSPCASSTSPFNFGGKAGILGKNIMTASLS